MKRLAGTDAAFVSLETATSLQHVCGVIILDPSSPSFSFGRLEATLRERITFLPQFSWRLREIPLGIARPVWVEDATFDVTRHIRRIAVPSPGGRREFGELVGQLHSQPLDRRIPLWEMWFIEGVSGGRYSALLLKFHHSLMDGASGAGLGELLYDLEPDPEGPYAPPLNLSTAASPGNHNPSDIELLARALPNFASNPIRVLTYAAQLARRARVVAAKAGSMPGLNAPSTSLNGVVGRRRRMVPIGIALDDVKKLRKTLDVKVNDVVLAVIAGAIRRYLEDNEELPDDPLSAIMMVSTRQPDGGASNNSLATARVELATQIDDPIERLRAIHASTISAKEMLTAMRAKDIQSIGEVAPPLLLNLASRLTATSAVSRRMPRAASVVVSNVPGPPIPLYAAGARIMAIYSASVVQGNIASNFTCVSYVDRIDFGITVDPDLMTNVDQFADYLRQSLQDLLTAAGLGEAQAVSDPFED